MVTTRIPGFVLTDHVVEVPLDHSKPDDGRTIEVFAREVVAAGREHEDLAPNHHGWSKPVAGWGPCDPGGGAC